MSRIGWSRNNWLSLGKLYNPVILTKCLRNNDYQNELFRVTLVQDLNQSPVPNFIKLPNSDLIVLLSNQLKSGIRLLVWITLKVINNFRNWWSTNIIMMWLRKGRVRMWLVLGYIVRRIKGRRGLVSPWRNSIVIIWDWIFGRKSWKMLTIKLTMGSKLPPFQLFLPNIVKIRIVRLGILRKKQSKLFTNSRFRILNKIQLQKITISNLSSRSKGTRG